MEALTRGEGPAQCRSERPWASRPKLGPRPPGGTAGRKETLLKQIQTAHEPPHLLHPGMADLCRTKLEQLPAALQGEDTRLEASETLRGLIDSIVLTPKGR